MKVLIIGSNSFAGSHFINHLLLKDYEVVGISRGHKKEDLPYDNNNKNYEYGSFDINEDTDDIIDMINDSNFDAIINFSAMSIVQTSWNNPTLWMTTNCLSPMRIIKECQYDIQRFIQMSTPEVYGKIYIDDYTYKPSTPYAVSKASFDMYTKCMFDIFNFPIIYTRASNWYGPHQQDFKIIPKTILSILKKEKMRLDGNGESLRNFIYITDVCDALESILRYGRLGSVYHITGDNVITIKDLCNNICDKMDYKFENLIEQSNDRLGKDPIYKMDNRNLFNEFGWTPKIDLDMGLDLTIDWYRVNRKWK